MVTKDEYSIDVIVTKDESILNTDDYSGVYVLGSIDIVKSTYLKSVNNNWINLINSFYDDVLKEVKKFGFKFWKYIGDEVLFYKRIDKNNFREMGDWSKQIFESMIKIKEKIYNKYPGVRMFLSLKGTLWISNVSSLTGNLLKDFDELPQKKLERHKNFVITKIYSGGRTIDFLGPDIDLGFRISKESMKNQLLVSAEFVYLQHLIGKKNNLHETVSSLELYKIFENKNLKGIWHERKYPLMMYRPNWSDDIFDYDEVSKTLGDFNIKTLCKIFKDISRDKDIEKFYEEILKSNPIKKTSSITLESPVDIHLASIIFDEKDKVLLFRRGVNKSSAGKYDFGCLNLKQNMTIGKDITNYYNKINSSIELLKDEKTDKLIPVAIYEYGKNENIINGMIFTGRISDSDIILPNGYEDYKFVEIKDLTKEELFENSIDNIYKALKLLQDEGTSKNFKIF